MVDAVMVKLARNAPLLQNQCFGGMIDHNVSVVWRSVFG